MQISVVPIVHIVLAPAYDCPNHEVDPEGEGMSNRTLISVTLAFLLLPIAAAAQGTPAGTIYGYVLDPDHRPLPGARIVVEDPNTGATRAPLQSARLLFRPRAPARPLQHNGRGQRIRDRSPDRHRARGRPAGAT